MVNKASGSTYRAIDLFAGIGGIRMGFDLAFGNEIETVYACEFDENACKTYRANFNDPLSLGGSFRDDAWNSMAWPRLGRRVSHRNQKRGSARLSGFSAKRLRELFAEARLRGHAGCEQVRAYGRSQARRRPLVLLPPMRHQIPALRMDRRGEVLSLLKEHPPELHKAEELRR